MRNKSSASVSRRKSPCAIFRVGVTFLYLGSSKKPRWSDLGGCPCTGMYTAIKKLYNEWFNLELPEFYRPQSEQQLHISLFLDWTLLFCSGIIILLKPSEVIIINYINLTIKYMKMLLEMHK